VAMVGAVAVAIGGGFRVSIGVMRISVTSPWPPLLLGVALVALRHVLVPRPTIAARVTAWIERLTSLESWRAVWAPFVITRASVLIIGVLALFTIGIRADAPPLRVANSDLVNVPLRWDAGWYLSIARVGYMWTPRDVGRPQNIAFFPAFPMAMRVVGRLFGSSGVAYLYGGLVISHVAFLWALLLLYQLARDDLGDRAAASGTVLLLACYPFSVFHAAVYTESLFLLACVGAVLGFKRQRWVRSILWGALAGLTRPNGCLLALTLATLIVASRPRKREGITMIQIGALGAVVGPVAGAAIYWLFLWQFTGNPFQWSEQHEAWGRTFLGFDGLFATRADAVMDAVPALLALAASIPIGMRLGPAYAVFIIANLLPPLMFGGFMSTGRLTATLFPLFIWLGWLTRRNPTLVGVTFALFQGLLATLFYTWRPPA
jgi:mannosyltransferase PIG-V